jgi:small-conductance mechanosensitive channel
VLFYFIVISILLESFGISLSTALAGGAVGGIIIGLAVQTIVTSVLSWFLVSSSRTILPGEVLLIQSSLGATLSAR